MRTAPYSVVGAILVILAVCGQASATTCQDLKRQDEETYNHLKKLYEYARIAEASKVDILEEKKDNVEETNKCVGGNGNVIAELPENIKHLEVPTAFLDEVQVFVDEHGNGTNIGRAKLRLIGPKEHPGRTFSIECSTSADDRSVLVEFGFSVLARAFGDRVEFFLTGTALKGKTFVRGAEETIVVAPGTDLGKLEQIMANFRGDECVFPVFEQTVSVFCETLRTADNSGIFGSFAEKNHDYVDLFNKEHHSLTLVGHSLGGSATQYVATNLPDECNPEGRLEKFDTFAFASPGFRTSAEYQKNSDDLHGYLINGDLVLQSIFSKRIQGGQVIIYTPPEPQQSRVCPGHFIEEVRETICVCLRGDGQIDEFSGVVENGKILAAERCSEQNAGQSP